MTGRPLGAWPGAARLAVAVALGAGAHGAPAQPARSGGGSARAESYAVIVHPAVPVSGVTTAQLRGIFLGARRSWDDGTPLVILVQTPGVRTRAVLLREVYRMDEGAFKRYWIARTFRNDVGPAGPGGGPTLVSSDALARRLTATIPGAIAVVPASAVDGAGLPPVRVLRIDGRLPGADGYPLTANPP